MRTCRAKRTVSTYSMSHALTLALLFTYCVRLSSLSCDTLSLYSLKFLSVAKIYGLTDHSISVVAKHLSALEFLNLQGCWRVTDRSVFLVAEYCKKLKRIHVRECRDISMACVHRLTEKGVKVDIVAHKLRLTEQHLAHLRALPM